MHLLIAKCVSTEKEVNKTGENYEGKQGENMMVISLHFEVTENPRQNPGFLFFSFFFGEFD